MPSKETPKSCSCHGCKASKGCKGVQIIMKKEERAFRHARKIALNKHGDSYFIAPRGGRYG